ncbi:MAG: endonuclease/exonuclease/phosphatase family protein [Actinomycetota bacterium]
MTAIPVGEGLWRWGRWILEPESDPSGSDLLAFGILEFNFCGSNCLAGDVGAPVEDLANMILGSRPSIVLLNEICLAQADRLWSILDRAGYLTSGAFGATTGLTRCPGAAGQAWFGNAVFSRGPGLGEPELIALPNPVSARERRSAVAMVAEFRGEPVRAICTHLVPGGWDRSANLEQQRALAGAVDLLVQRCPAVVAGGDFNVLPQEVELYGGRLVEVDARNRATYGRRKIDYIFLSRDHFYGPSAATVYTRHSDHRQLWATSTLMQV